MPTIEVDTLADVVAADGMTSLREAVDLASPGDTITFASGLSGGTITLTSGISISDDITIEGDLDGNNSADITIDGGGSTWLFSISSPSFVALNSLNLQNAIGSAVTVSSGSSLNLDHVTFSDNAGVTGGAIQNAGTTSAWNSVFSGNSATLDGGAINNSGVVETWNVVFEGNNAGDQGGAIFTSGTCSLTNTTLTGNSATTEGGGAYTSGTLDVTNTLIVGNTAPAGSEVQTTGTLSDSGGSLLSGTPSDIFAAIDGTTGGGLLADNGGVIQSVALNISASNPALDIGLDGPAPSTDAIGQTRNDFTGVGADGTNFSDAGAYEAQCYCAGTMIAEAFGQTAVENLKIGGQILTNGGDLVRIRWIGRQTVMTRFGPAERLMPVRFAAGSLGEGLPQSDLTVTADHGMLVDGVICHAGALVNGTTITRVPLAEMGETYTVYHIETEEHEIILANGAPAETFIDNVSRRVFDNYAEFEALFGDVPEMQELPHPRAMSARQVPARIFARLNEGVAA